VPRLLSHDKDICYGVVHRRWPPYDPIAFKDDDKGRVHVSDEEIYSGDLIEINNTGMGCVLIKMEVFESIKRPWFHEHITEDGKPIGEDCDFLMKAQKAGFKIFMDTSIQVGHVWKMIFNRSTYMIYKADTKLQWKRRENLIAA
jgi:hypothetical protein